MGNGRISVSAAGVGEMGKAMMLPSATGGKVLIIDIKNVPVAGKGPGIIVGVKRQDVSGLDLGGDYHFNDDDGGYGDVTVTNATNTYAGIQYDALGNPTPIGGSFARNDPWTGWLRDAVNDMIILILPGDGVWFNTQLTPQNNWISVGGVIP